MTHFPLKFLRLTCDPSLVAKLNSGAAWPTAGCVCVCVSAPFTKANVAKPTIANSSDFFMVVVLMRIEKLYATLRKQRINAQIFRDRLCRTNLSKSDVDFLDQSFPGRAFVLRQVGRVMIAGPAQKCFGQLVARKIGDLVGEKLHNRAVALLGRGVGDIPAQPVLSNANKRLAEQVLDTVSLYAVAGVFCAEDRLLPQRFHQF